MERGGASAGAGRWQQRLGRPEACSGARGRGVSPSRVPGHPRAPLPQEPPLRSKAGDQRFFHLFSRSKRYPLAPKPCLIVPNAFQGPCEDIAREVFSQESGVVLPGERRFHRPEAPGGPWKTPAPGVFYCREKGNPGAELAETETAFNTIDDDSKRQGFSPNCQPARVCC